MKRFLAVVVLVLAAFVVPGLSGCGSHEHSSDPTRETEGGQYTCPRHGDSYASADDHCKVCNDHVQKK